MRDVFGRESTTSSNISPSQDDNALGIPKRRRQRRCICSGAFTQRPRGHRSILHGLEVGADVIFFSTRRTYYCCGPTYHDELLALRPCPIDVGRCATSEPIPTVQVVFHLPSLPCTQYLGGDRWHVLGVRQDAPGVLWVLVEKRRTSGI